MHVVHRCRFTEWQPTAVNSLSFSVDGSRLAVARNNGDIELWANFSTSNMSEYDTTKDEINKYLQKNPVPKTANSAVIISAANAFPTSSQWHCHRVIPGNGQPIITGLFWTVVDYDSNPLTAKKDVLEHRLFSVGLNSQIVEWDLETYIPKFSCDSYGGPIWCAALSPSGCQMVLGCNDGTLRIFDISVSTTVPHYLRALHKHSKRVLCVDWLHHSHVAPPNTIVNSQTSITGNPNVVKTETVSGRTGSWWDPPLVISGGEDGCIKTWHVVSAKCLNTIRSDAVREDRYPAGFKHESKENKNDDFLGFDGSDEEDEDDEEDLEDIGLLPGLSNEKPIFGTGKSLKKKKRGRKVSRNAIVKLKWIDAETAVATDGKGQLMIVEVRLGSIVTTLPLTQKMGAVTDIVVIPASPHTASVNHTSNKTYPYKYKYQASYQPGLNNSKGVAYPVLFVSGATGCVLQIIATHNKNRLNDKNVTFGHQHSWIESGSHEIHTHDILALAFAPVPLEAISSIPSDNDSQESDSKKPRLTANINQTCSMMLVSGGVDTNLIMYSAQLGMDEVTNKATQANISSAFANIRPRRIMSFPYKANTHHSLYTPNSNVNVSTGASKIVSGATANKSIRVTPASGNGNLPLVAVCNPIINAINSTVNPTSQEESESESESDVDGENMKRVKKNTLAELPDLYPQDANIPNPELLHALTIFSPTAAAVASAPPAAPRVATVHERSVNLYSLGNTVDPASMTHRNSIQNPHKWALGKLGPITANISATQGNTVIDISSIAATVMKSANMFDNEMHNKEKHNKKKPVAKVDSDSDSDSEMDEIAKVSNRRMSIMNHPLTKKAKEMSKPLPTIQEEGDESGVIKALDIKEMADNTEDVTAPKTKTMNVSSSANYKDGRNLDLSVPHTHLAKMTLASRLHVQTSTLAPNGSMLAAADTTAIRLFTFATGFTGVQEDEEDEHEVLVERVVVNRVNFPPMPPQIQPDLQDFLNGSEDGQAYELTCALTVLSQAGASIMAFSPDSSLLAVAATGLTNEALHTNILGTDDRVLVNSKYKSAVYLIDMNLYQVVAVISENHVLPLTQHVGLPTIIAAAQTVSKTTKKKVDDDSDSDSDSSSDEEVEDSVTVTSVWGEDASDNEVIPPFVRDIAFSQCSKFITLADENNNVRVYSLTKKQAGIVAFAPHLHCVLPQLPQPLTNVIFLPIPVINTKESSSIINSSTFDIHGILWDLDKKAAAAKSLSASTPSNKKGGRASTLFTPAVRAGGVNLLEASQQADKKSETSPVVSAVLQSLGNIQTTGNLKSLVPESPAIFGVLASGSFFIFDTHARTFITYGLGKDHSKHNPFVSIPFPTNPVDYLNIANNKKENCARIPNKERITNVTIAGYNFSRFVKTSIPDKLFGKKTKTGFFQANIPYITLMLQTPTLSFNFDIPATVLCSQLIPQLVRAAVPSSSTQRKRKEVGDNNKSTFAAQCEELYALMPKCYTKTIFRFTNLLDMGYADPHPVAISGAIRQFFKNRHITKNSVEKEQTDDISIPSQSLVVVEAPWLQILANMPDRVYQKKFGKH